MPWRQRIEGAHGTAAMLPAFRDIRTGAPKSHGSPTATHVEYRLVHWDRSAGKGGGTAVGRASRAGSTAHAHVGLRTQPRAASASLKIFDGRITADAFAASGQ